MIFNKYFPDARNEDERKKKIENFVLGRKQRMENERKKYSERWDDYIKQYDAEYQPYKNQPFKSSSKVPLVSALTEMYASYALKMKTQYNFECYENKDKGRLAKKVRDHDRTKNKRFRTIWKDEFDCACFGTSIMYHGIDSISKTQYTLSEGDTIDFKEEQIKEVRVRMENVKINEFYLSETATGIEDAVDCIRIVNINKDSFDSLTKNNPLYSNTEEVKSTTKMSQSQEALANDKTQNILTDNNIRIVCYWNVEKDMYVEIANGVLVRANPIMTMVEGKKVLPFTFRIFGKKMGGIYGRGYAEASLMFNSEINDLRELYMNSLKKSSAQQVLIGSGLSFDGKNFGFTDSIEHVKGMINDSNFRIINGKNSDPGLQNATTNILNQIGMRVGVDINNMNDPKGTAFQTQVQQEGSQRRVNVVMTNRDLAYERLADIHMSNLIQYYSLEDDPEKKKVVFKDEKRDSERQIFLGGEDNKGNNIVEIGYKDLEGDFSIEINTNITAPTISSIDRQLKTEFLQSVGEIAQSVAVAKQSGFDVNNVLDMDQTMKKLASDYGLEEHGENTAEEREAKQEMMDFKDTLQGMMKPGALQPQEQPQEQPLPAM